jgi:hypothetical protein
MSLPTNVTPNECENLRLAGVVELATEIADRFDAAADLITDGGLAYEEYFDDREQYGPGAACCVIAALGVATGYRTTAQLDDEFVNHHRGDGPGGWVPHPVLAAFLAYRGVDFDGLTDWSDRAEASEVIAVLRQAAQDVRAAVTSAGVDAR